MCGLSGVVRPSGIVGEDQDLVTELNHRQRHRGPDGNAVWRGERAVLGHTRLAVIDLTDGGRQPFVAADGSVSVVFNGELYNHEELRRRYGLTAPDRCDGAILPELWKRLGTAMFAQLRGMYGIAVCDSRSGTVTLARDPFGIKPLCYTQNPAGVLAFASEPRALVRLIPKPRLCGDALRNYLTFGAMGRDQSPFQDIEMVPANGWVQWDQPMIRTQGTIHMGLFDDLGRTTPRQLRAGFLDSVAAHLCSDVPVALLLSSGLDSAAIAWACAELGTALTCVTVDMGDGVSEMAGARRLAARFGHSYELVSTNPENVTLERYFTAMQKPSIDGLNTFVVSRAIAALGVKVALSGLGGDELLAGYPAFRLLRYLPLLRLADKASLTPLLSHLYRGGNHKLAQLLAPTGPRDAHGLGTLIRQVLTQEQVNALASVPGHTSRTSLGPSRNDRSARALSLVELAGYLGGTLLPDTDAFSMAWSVEMRVPYVDVPFAQTALAVEPERGLGKERFAEALGDTELRRVARRRKLGFTMPMQSWMRHGPLARWVTDARQRDAPVRAVLRADAVQDLMLAWDEGRVGWSRAWLLVSLDAWLRSIATDVAAPEPMYVGGPQ